MYRQVTITLWIARTGLAAREQRRSIIFKRDDRIDDLRRPQVRVAVEPLQVGQHRSVVCRETVAIGCDGTLFALSEVGTDERLGQRALCCGRTRWPLVASQRVRRLGDAGGATQAMRVERRGGGARVRVGV